MHNTILKNSSWN